jgi:flagellar hook-length control protein FliK
VSGVVSEAAAVRHAHLGQGPRGNLPSAESADQTSPFASLLDGASDAAPPPASPPPASPAPPSQKLAARPPDGQTAQSSSATIATGTQKSPSGSPAPGSQTGGVSSSPLSGPKGTDIAETAFGLLAKKAAKDTKSTIDANVDVTVTNGATDATARNNAVDATAGSSTAAAITDIHGEPAKSDSNASGSAPSAAPPTDPSANQPIPVAPQPVAVAISAPVIPAAPTTLGSASGNGSDSGTGQDAAQIAALGDAIKAGTPRGKAADPSSADSAKGGGGAKGGSGTTADTPTGGDTKPAAKIADAVKSTPSPTPQPIQKDLIPPTGPGQPNAADGTQSRNPEGAPGTEAATNHARERAVISQPTDGTAGQQGNSSVDPNVDPNVDSKRDPAGSANRIEDITRQALDTTVRHQAPAAEIASGGPSHPGSSEAGSAQQSPDGSSGTIAPAILTTSAAATAAPATTATPSAIPIAGLAVEIASHARAGKNRFEIRLDPPELGRIDVRLDVDREGKVTSRLVVDRPETLDLLRRDAPELERSLQQAGLETADNALQFSLRDHGGFGGQNPYPNSGSPAGATRVVIPDQDLPPVDATTGYGRAIGTSAGVDIRV